jgi:integrase
MCLSPNASSGAESRRFLRLWTNCLVILRGEILVPPFSVSTEIKSTIPFWKRLWNARQNTVGSIVRHCLLRAGLDAPTYGAHQFRHGLATEMLRQGASLGEIGELLGHHSSQITKIYTKVDLDALRTLALPWPGGVR